jgi:hypothetical protein
VFIGACRRDGLVGFPQSIDALQYQRSITKNSLDRGGS